MRYIIIILILLFPFLGFSQDKIPVKQLDIGAVKSPNAKASLYIADKRNDNLIPGTDIQSGLFFSLKTPATVGIPKTGGNSFGSTLTIVPWLDDTGNDYAAYRLTGYNGNLYYQFYNNGSWLSQNIIATQGYVQGIAGTGLDYDENTGKIVWGKHIYSSLYGIDVNLISIPANEAINIGAKMENITGKDKDSAFLFISQRNNAPAVALGTGVSGSSFSFMRFVPTGIEIHSNKKTTIKGPLNLPDVVNGTNPNGKVLTVDANDKVVLTEISQHNGEQVLQEAPTSAIFSSDVGTAGTETLDIGTIGNDWSYTIPAGTFLSTSDEIYIDISFRFEITNHDQSTSSNLYLHVTDGTSSFNVDASGYVGIDKYSRPIDHIIITSRTSGLVYVMSPYSGTTSQSLDITKDITVSFRYNRDNASSEDVSILPVIIQTSDVNN